MTFLVGNIYNGYEGISSNIKHDFRSFLGRLYHILVLTYPNLGWSNPNFLTQPPITSCSGCQGTHLGSLDRWTHWCHTDLFSVNKLVSGGGFPKKTNPLNGSMYIHIYIYVSICMYMYDTYCYNLYRIHGWIVWVSWSRHGPSGHFRRIGRWCWWGCTSGKWPGTPRDLTGTYFDVPQCRRSSTNHWLLSALLNRPFHGIVDDTGLSSLLEKQHI